jgi:hypothetical protein
MSFKKRLNKEECNMRTPHTKKVHELHHEIQITYR